MDNGILGIAFISLVLLLSGCTTGQVGTTPAANTPPAITAPPSDSGGIVVRMTDNGFEPNAVTVPAGTAVRFSNEDGVAHWPASAPHPVHTDYPEFDAKRGIAPGESYSFVFDKVGTWKFHDHLNCCSNPKWFGTVAVQ